jgi:transcription elongation factor GreA
MMNTKNTDQWTTIKRDFKVAIGCRVSVVDLSTGELLEYKLISSAKPDMQYDEVSSWSPLGKALLGRRVDETVYVQVPRSTLCYKIVKITESG